jgi:beta-lactamase superfamily II metal-dependent hydrolase
MNYRRSILFRIGTAFAILCLVICCRTAVAQEAAYFALQRPGQGNLAVDKARKVAYITDLGKNGDGNNVMIDEVPLIDSLIAQGIETLVFTCSHPHSDHSGGIRALFEAPEVFFNDSAKKVPRFRSIVVIESGVEDSLFTILSDKLGSNSAIKLTRVDAAKKNAFAAYSKPSDAVYIENIPYEPIENAGPHGRSIVTHFVLGQKYSNVDFDDASSAVIVQTVNALKAKGVMSIDSFVVPHHGSAYHDIEPILGLAPKKAIITVNPRNPYGHPSPSILLALMDKLGPENVFFTGSIDHVVLDPDGVKHARYTAQQAESFNLFVSPSYEREKAKANPTSLALYRQLESRMTGGSTVAQSDIQRDELQARLEAAEGANDDLLAIADKLALGITPSPKQKKQFDDSVRNQALRLKALQNYIEKYGASTTTDLTAERARIDRLLRQIQPDTTSGVNNSDGGSLEFLSQAVALGIQELFASVPEQVPATRNVAEARYTAPTNSVRLGEPEVSPYRNTPVKIPPQKIAPYDEMEASPEERPGGIAIGNIAIADPTAALDQYVLGFDSENDFLLLFGPNHARIQFDHPIDPLTLKALYRFAASNRSAAVSIEQGADKETVRLDPSLVDTQVGRNLIAADLVGGDLLLYGFIYRDDESFEHALDAATKDFDPCIGFTSISATWFDSPSTIHVNGNEFNLTGRMRLEFVSHATSLNQASCKGMDCRPPSSKHSPPNSQFCNLRPLEKFVEENYSSLIERFPSIDDMNDYARIVDFLRWARRPGHLAGINLAGLADVPAADRNYRTPDLLTDR